MIRRLALATALLTLVAPAASAHASSGMEFALQDDAVFVNEYFMPREKALQHAKKLGAQRIRVNVLWARTLVSGAKARKAPKKGAQYDFTRLDALQQSAAAKGMKLQLTLSGPAPAWATKDHKVGANQPDARKFAAFVRAVAAHFAGRVDRYSIWNEPNLSAWLAPTNKAPRLYRSLYKAGYTAIKTVDPKAQVLFGELAPTGNSRTIAPLAFMRAAATGNLRADGLALHPYQLTSAPTVLAGGPDDAPISQLKRVTKLLDQLAKAKKLRNAKGKGLDLYLTEFGYLSKGTRALPQKTRAKYLKAAYQIARKNRRVRQILQYQLVDGPKNGIWNSAVMTNDGKPQGAYSGLTKAIAAFAR
jgi:cellulase (glycosyl hydrolase family 5)